MGISNDWQNIDEISYVTITASRRNGVCWSEQSAQKMADALGWEVVKFPDEITTVDFNGATQDATVITMIRPVDNDEPYNVGFFIGEMFGANGYGDTGPIAYEISTGNKVASYDYFYNNASFLVLRTSAQGCFAIKDSSNRVILFDRFYNPKSGKEKWGFFFAGAFLDFYTGLVIGHDIKEYTNLGGYIALKKFTVYAQGGVYNALSLYHAYIDYAKTAKNIELDGKRYCGVVYSTSYNPFYIPLAD